MKCKLKTAEKEEKCDKLTLKLKKKIINWQLTLGKKIVNWQLTLGKKLWIDHELAENNKATNIEDFPHLFKCWHLFSPGN